ncbi:C69 family dipeptidase [bacterium]|nr:C69 family dipeptidase [bacterium]
MRMQRIAAMVETPRVACDSLVALGAATADGAVLFAKNSDRPAAEPQPLLQRPARRHPPGARLRCTYIEIPQVAATARLIGSRPYWCWGFEHGLNEHGVAIGNHTVFTRDPLGAPGLIGMDLVRLGLERAASAARAVEVITDLAAAYGQGGSGYADKDWPYHNSFLVADRREAYLVETSDRRWAVRRAREVDSASNHLAIGADWDGLADDTIEHAIANGWWPEDAGGRFDFAAAYRDTATAPAVVSNGRHRRTCELLAAGRGRLTPAALRAALRDHYGATAHRAADAPDDERYFGVCMHADPVGTTTASMIARLPEDRDDLLRYWGSLGSPCAGVFLPYYVDGELPAALARGGAEPTPDAPWWRFKHLLTLVEQDVPRRAPHARAFWDEFERMLDGEAAEVEHKAVRLRRAGQVDSAARLLTRFMDANVALALERLERLIGELAS